MIRRLISISILSAVAGQWLGCSEENPPLPIRNLDRPSTAAFACYGDLRITDEDSPDEGDLRVSAQPVESCRAHARGEPPAGQEQLAAPRIFGFVLQGSRGTVAVVDSESQTVLDSDPLTPGKNAIPIGTLPVGLTPDESGCFMVSTSAASCDLAILDVTSALDIDSAARIARVPIKNSADVTMRAKARTLIGGAPREEVGRACPREPEGKLYVAYPACHLVAVVDATSGKIEAGIQFAEDGTATITDGAVECPAECGLDETPEAVFGPGPPDGGPVDGGAPDAGTPPDAGPPTTDDAAPRPVTVFRDDGGRLYMGSENSSIITLVDLDDEGMPDLIRSIQLEGAVGVTSLAVSSDIDNSGESGREGGNGGFSRYVYAVATDRTVRVVRVEEERLNEAKEVERPFGLFECDTQVDPRMIHGVGSISQTACYKLGPDTPARRPGATGPGISMPLDEAPLDVAFADVHPPPTDVEPSPFDLRGTFAFVTTTRGNVYIVNVDDDNYPDTERSVDEGDDPAQMAEVSLSLALAHQIRDFGSNRAEVAAGCGESSAADNELGPRAVEAPTRVYSEGRIAFEKLHLMPSIHQVECAAGAEVDAVSELQFNAPVDVRELAFPDWRAVASEDWSVTFEGLLSTDSFGSSVDGPPVRSGTIEADGFELSLIDPSASFCQLGAEPLDAVQLIGCDPTLGDGQCALGETCFVHPDAPSVVTTGMCLPADRAEMLSGRCRDFLITRRNFSAAEVRADRVLLVPRRRALRTTPIDGCASDDECKTMAAMEPTLADPAHPTDLGMPPESRFDWVCRHDPSRPPGPDRCLMACEDTSDCESGNVCLAGYCNEGVPPAEECVPGLQRYQVRGSDAFVVIGTQSGYLHNIVKNPDTGVCEQKDPVTDPTYSPLNVGRIPLRPPPCPPKPDVPTIGEEIDAEIATISPNPCSVQVDQFDRIPQFRPQGNECVADGEPITSRMTTALRYQNPSVRFHLVDVATRGDEVCNGDRAVPEDERPLFSGAYPGFEIDFSLTGGFRPMFVPFGNALPLFPVRLVPSPDGRMWVMDQGDAAGAAGRVFTFVPTAAPADIFAPVLIQ
jgi:hypothetical protein